MQNNKDNDTYNDMTTKKHYNDYIFNIAPCVEQQRQWWAYNETQHKTTAMITAHVKNPTITTMHTMRTASTLYTMTTNINNDDNSTGYYTKNDDSKNNAILQQ